MTGASNQHLPGLSRRNQAFWLPYGGHGNGLTADAWVPLAEVLGEYAAALLLADLHDAGIPAYAARLHPPRGPSRVSGPLPGRVSNRQASGRGTDPHVGIWVAAASYGTAEALLLTLIPAISAQVRRQILP